MKQINNMNLANIKKTILICGLIHSIIFSLCVTNCNAQNDAQTKSYLKGKWAVLRLDTLNYFETIYLNNRQLPSNELIVSFDDGRNCIEYFANMKLTQSEFEDMPLPEIHYTNWDINNGVFWADDAIAFPNFLALANRIKVISNNEFELYNVDTKQEIAILVRKENQYNQLGYKNYAGRWFVNNERSFVKKPNTNLHFDIDENGLISGYNKLEKFSGKLFLESNPYLIILYKDSLQKYYLGFIDHEVLYAVESAKLERNSDELNIQYDVNTIEFQSNNFTDSIHTQLPIFNSANISYYDTLYTDASFYRYKKYTYQSKNQLIQFPIRASYSITENNNCIHIKHAPAAILENLCTTDSLDVVPYDVRWELRSWKLPTAKVLRIQHNNSLDLSKIMLNDSTVLHDENSIFSCECGTAINQNTNDVAIIFNTNKGCGTTQYYWSIGNTTFELTQQNIVNLNNYEAVFVNSNPIDFNYKYWGYLPESQSFYDLRELINTITITKKTY